MSDQLHREPMTVGDIVDVHWLAAQLGRDDVVVVDCRFDLADRDAGERAYALNHIPGARYFDLERDLSRQSGGEDDSGTVPTDDASLASFMTSTGGRHPLPALADVVALFGAAGIGDGVQVVGYDDQKGAMAARLWWMLKLLGHESVALLDGGYGAWQSAGYAVTTEVPSPTPRTFTPRPQPAMMASIDEVRRVSMGGPGVIIDSRAPARYRGEVEPLDPVAGHIPGAVNVPWEGNVHDDGTWIPGDGLAQRFDAIVPTEHDAHDAGDVIVHCGSGVTGCVNVLALKQLGVSRVKLYVGGWSEWCSDDANPVAVGDGGST